jgi:hypothetical protein
MSGMRGDILPLHQYAFTAWCSVKASGLLYFTLLYFTYTPFGFYNFRERDNLGGGGNKDGILKYISEK